MAVDAALGVLTGLLLGRLLLFTVLLCTSLRERQTSDPLRQLAHNLKYNTKYIQSTNEEECQTSNPLRQLADYLSTKDD